jgi:hypothetical protein
MSFDHYWLGSPNSAAWRTYTAGMFSLRVSLNERDACGCIALACFCAMNRRSLTGSVCIYTALTAYFRLSGTDDRPRSSGVFSLVNKTRQRQNFWLAPLRAASFRPDASTQPAGKFACLSTTLPCRVNHGGIGSLSVCASPPVDSFSPTDHAVAGGVDS